jgi:signal transduction histidine kinase
MSSGADSCVNDPDADALDVLLRASRCEVQRQVIGGLLHDLNGPLNNIALTLALVTTGIARSVAAAPDDPAMTRLARHVATLEAEVRRLAECSQAMGRSLQDDFAGASAEPIVLEPLVAEIRRRLRHHAALHEIVFEDIDAEDSDIAVRAARDALQLALSALLLGACAACTPESRVGFRIARRGAQATLTVSARAAVLSPEVRDALDTMVMPPPAGALHLAAGRRAVQAQGGLVSFAHGANDVVIDIAFPAAR